MKVVIQRVNEASVKVEGALIATIGKGLLILLGIEQEDGREDAEWLVKKISQLRIFRDNRGVMNLSVNEVNGEVLVISQFTLLAKTKKGNRPSYAHAAPPDKAIPLYEEFVSMLRNRLKGEIKTGRFGAYMQVSMVNDGPVTIVIDTKRKE
ncbi:MAG: D-tyrosyl-tRNA(Tyr) deacylase [Bacteroidales bacterium]|nr:D-tyrosyl-tRNA(Tyr) deacylase [Bacteroidales bacterium]